jgi:putative ABC transport system permease protein
MRRVLAELGESIRMALSAVAAHKLRSGLTLLGVLVGVFSIILVMTAMRAMQNNVEQNLGALGSKAFVIQRMPGVFFEGPEGMLKYWRRREVSIAQAQLFQRKAIFAPYIGLQMDVGSLSVASRFAITPPNVSLKGGTPGVFVPNNWNIVEGRPLVEADVDSARDICVLSSDVAKVLFPRGSAVGERVRIESLNYNVVGVFERAASADSGQAIAVMPITAALNRYGRRREVSIVVQAADIASLPDMVEQSRGLMRAIRKVPPGTDDDFEILTSDAMIQQFERVTLAVRTGLALVSSIALLAAGVGIMNTMLVSVTERTREIGIRRAIGAKKRNIMAQFIVEAVVLCEIGGLLGVAFGMAGANALAVYVLKMPPAFPVDWAILGLVICSVIGIVFGSYPAFKAANVDPIEALRYE